MKRKQTQMDKLVDSAIDQIDDDVQANVIEAFANSFTVTHALLATQSVIRYALYRLSKGIPADAAVMPLANGVSPVSGETLCKLAENMAEKCRKEITGVGLLRMATMADGTLEMYLKRRAFWMPLTPGDYEVNDPVNGQNVNKRTVELTVALDRATEEGDAEKEAQLRTQLLYEIMEEAERENPVAVINLGMRYLEGSDQLPKDIPHAIPLIVKAEQMGVRYASYLLHTL